MHDHAYADGRFRCIAALGFSDQTALGDAMPHQVITPNAAFAEARIGSGAAGGNDDRRNSAVKKIESVIKAGPQHGRRTAGIFRRPKNHDDICRMDFLERSRVHNLNCRNQ